MPAGHDAARGGEGRGMLSCLLGPLEVIKDPGIWATLRASAMVYLARSPPRRARNAPADRTVGNPWALVGDQ